MKRTISIILSILIVVSSFAMLTFTSFAADGISYTFSGSDKDTPGYAQGTVTITGTSGATYYLYWANASGALDGYYEIDKIKASGTTATLTFSERVAIPKDAEYLAAYKGTSEPSNKSISNATYIYKIPNSKLIGDDLSYSFAAFSDLHITAKENGSYVNDNYKYAADHLCQAFNAAAARDVDFVVTSGDHINNQVITDNGLSYNKYYVDEWDTYLKTIANSNYANPIYEAIGNHELWNGAISEHADGEDTARGTAYFNGITGLDSSKSTIDAGKAYYEITEPKTGDHFIFLALEGGFYTDRVEEFSAAQLDWLKGKLEAYKNDGKHVFIVEHANFYNWGAGDVLGNPLYDIPLKDSCSSSLALKNLLKTYKNAMVITGHTHFQFSDVVDLSDNTKTSSYIIHNASIGNTRRIINGERVDTPQQDLTQGYITEVYGDGVIYNGTNFYYNKIYPKYSYIIGTPSSKPVGDIYYGDADCNDEVNIVDATCIQKHLAMIITLTDKGLQNAKVENGESLTITDATLIQKFIAKMINKFPVEDLDLAQTGEIAAIGAQDTTNAEKLLNDNYTFASYDQYQALKKCVKDIKAGKERTDLSSLSTTFSSLVSSFAPKSTSKIYFTNSDGWSNVKIYWWGSKGTNPTWENSPAMTYVGTNKYSEKVYSYYIPNDVTAIIFRSNSGLSQTTDIYRPCFGFKDNQGYYVVSWNLKNVDGKKTHAVNTYTYTGLN